MIISQCHSVVERGGWAKQDISLAYSHCLPSIFNCTMHFLRVFQQGKLRGWLTWLVCVEEPSIQKIIHLFSRIAISHPPPHYSQDQRGDDLSQYGNRRTKTEGRNNTTHEGKSKATT